MFYCAFGLYPKLAIVAIDTMHNPDALDLLGGEGFNPLLGITDEPKATNATRKAVPTCESYCGEIIATCLLSSTSFSPNGFGLKHPHPAPRATLSQGERESLMAGKCPCSATGPM